MIVRSWHALCILSVLEANETMKIAIPIFGGRVAPVFDWCRRIGLVDTDSGEWSSREELDVSGVMPLNRPRYLVGLGVEVLVCGGISPELAELMDAHGVRVVSWVAGEVDVVLSEFAAGRLPSEEFMMPGRRGRGCGRRHRRGRRR